MLFDDFSWGFWIQFCEFLFLSHISASLQAELTLALEHGVPPDNIILAGVFKQLAFIKHAAKNNIQHLVCENEPELIKIARLHPDAK